MTPTPIVVRPPRAADEAAWRRLWAAYLDFYEATIDPAATDLTLQRILDPTSAMFGRVAEREGVLVGFAICVVHDGSWSVKPITYLEDLYVDPAVRGAGVGRALLDHILALSVERGWASIYWHTRAGNTKARRLYDRYVIADDFVRYRIHVQFPEPSN